jgi:ketosteroid isomerase-like protein
MIVISGGVMLKFAALVSLVLCVGAEVGGQEQLPNQYVTAEQKLERERLSAEAELHRQELMNLENEAAHAIQLNSMTFFRRVYSDDFTGTLSHGQLVNKAEFIEALQNPEMKYLSFVASDVSIRTFDETAVATCMWSLRGTYKGKSVVSQMRVLHVYINSPRGWRVVAGQLTSLPPIAEQPL